MQYEGVQCGRWPHLSQLSQVGLTIAVPFHLPLVLLISDNRVYIPMTIPSLRIFGGSFIAFTHRHRSPSMSMEYNRVPASIFSILAEHDWRFSVVEGDNSIIPQNTPKSKPLIGATRELLLFMISACWANQSEAWILGYNGIATTLNLQSLKIFLSGTLAYSILLDLPPLLPQFVSIMLAAVAVTLIHLLYCSSAIVRGPYCESCACPGNNVMFDDTISLDQRTMAIQRSEHYSMGIPDFAVLVTNLT